MWRRMETCSSPRQRRHRRQGRAGLVTGVVVGVASAALGLGVAELVAGFLGRTATPVIAVGEAFIDRVPGWLKDLAVAWFGTADKAVLIAGVLVVFAVLSAGIGVLTTRRRGAGVLVAGGLGFVAIVATWTRPDTTVTDLWPAVVGVIVSLIALDLLAGRAATAYSQTTSQEVDRRRFLRASGIVVAMAAASYAAGRWLGLRRSSVEESRESVAQSDDSVAPRPAPTSASTAPNLGRRPTASSIGSTRRCRSRWCGPKTGGCGSTGWSSGR